MTCKPSDISAPMTCSLANLDPLALAYKTTHQMNLKALKSWKIDKGTNKLIFFSEEHVTMLFLYDI